MNLEAQACGVPVVTTTSGGIPEAVSHQGAVLVPEGDVRALRDALADLVAHPERWPEMGRAGRAHVVLRHRIILNFEAIADDVKPETVIDAIFDSVQAP